MKYRIIASDRLYQRMLKLELDALGLCEADRGEDCGLLVAEGQNEIGRFHRLRCAVFIDCGMLAAGLPDSVKVLILSRPFLLEDLRNFVRQCENTADTALRRDMLKLNRDELTVTFGDGTVKLTRKEFAVFEYLHDRPGETVSRQELIEALWKGDTMGTSNVVDVYISFLRKKIDEHFGFRFIQSVRHDGYRYLPDIRDESEN